MPTTTVGLVDDPITFLAIVNIPRGSGKGAVACSPLSVLQNITSILLDNLGVGCGRHFHALLNVELRTVDHDIGLVGVSEITSLADKA